VDEIERDMTRTRFELVLDGDLEWTDLTETERVALNKQLDDSIRRFAESVSLGAELNAQGLPAIVLDEAGGVVRIDPDGSSHPV
jgi:hypothetical protein